MPPGRSLSISNSQCGGVWSGSLIPASLGGRFSRKDSRPFRRFRRQIDFQLAPLLVRKRTIVNRRWVPECSRYWPMCKLALAPRQRGADGYGELARSRLERADAARCSLGLPPSVSGLVEGDPKGNSSDYKFASERLTSEGYLGLLKLSRRCLARIYSRLPETSSDPIPKTALTRLGSRAGLRSLSSFGSKSAIAENLAPMRETSHRFVNHAH